MRLSLLIVSAVVLASCSSGGAPGAQTVLDQADKATKAQVDVALQNVARAEAEHLATNGTYTTDLAALGVSASEGVTVTVASADASAFCAEARHPDLEGIWHISSEAPIVTDGAC